MQGSFLLAAILTASPLAGGGGHVYVSGGGVQMKITGFIRPMTGKEINALRIQIDDLMARKAVALNDFKALERFRSFKKSKNAKKGAAFSEKDLEELKKKGSSD